MLQAAKATKEQIQPEVEALIALKGEYKTLTGQDFGAPAATKPAEEKVGGKQKQAPTAENAAKKAAKKEARRGGGGNDESTNQPAAAASPSTAAAAPSAAKVPTAAATAPPAPSGSKGLHYYPSNDAVANTKCWLVALTAGVTMTIGESSGAPLVPRWPAIIDHTTGTTIFGANAVCLYLALHSSAGKGGAPSPLLPAQGESTSAVEQVLDVEEFQLAPAVQAKVGTHKRRLRSYDCCWLRLWSLLSLPLHFGRPLCVHFDRTIDCFRYPLPSTHCPPPSTSHLHLCPRTRSLLPPS